MKNTDSTSGINDLISAAVALRKSIGELTLHAPVSLTYNPLEYAWEPYKQYLELYGGGSKRVLFFGMNPGPWGMGQTGIPFGEITRVTRWLGITGTVSEPRTIHPRRPITGFRTTRSEVSGRRLWDLFSQRFATPSRFFDHHFVANYCPLMFFDKEGRNLTPDRLCVNDRKSLFPVCDAHMIRLVEILKPQWVVGIGKFATRRAETTLKNTAVKVTGVLHPSPASPAANRDWQGQVSRSLEDKGIWSGGTGE